ncbi:MAG: hypothetical protein DRQ89_05855 [Epsilonproteobacteria bacterium]|nr:MAG: hypothetical protein DRQ89_05855 [Campylobacterota bacterium]
MKKILTGILLVILMAGIWRYFIKEEVVETNLEMEKKKEDIRASKGEVLFKGIVNSNIPKLNGRVVIGEGMKLLDKWPEKINYINKVDPNWDKKTMAHLNESSTYDRQVKITKKEGFVALNEGAGLYLERALVEFKQPDGSDGSFEAIINSQNGEIELVLNKNINESLIVEDKKVKYPDPDDAENFMASAEEIRELESADSDEIVEVMVSESNGDFDEYEYEEGIVDQAEEIAAKDTDEKHEMFVDKLKRDIARE